MSRVEKNIERSNKKRKRRFIYKVIFLLTMSITCSICIIVVDTNANIMLGNETYVEKTIKSLKEFQKSIKFNIKNINK